MGNIFCIVGTIALIIDVLVVLKTETDNGKEDTKKKTPKYVLDTSNVILGLSIIAVLSFVLFGVTLYLQGYM